MLAAKLDQRVTIRSAAVTGRNSMGEDVFGDPVDVGTFWARVEPLQGRELEAVQQRWAEARWKITIRRQPGIEIDRINTATWGSLTLDILDIQGAGTREQSWVLIARDFVA